MEKPEPKGPSLLVMDDDRDTLDGTARFFETRGFRVDCAAERAAAETLVAHKHYDCFMVDVALDGAQGADGLEILPFVKERSPLTAIVVLTGNGIQSLEQAALRHGAHMLLRKPQRLPELARAIDRLVGIGA